MNEQMCCMDELLCGLCVLLMYDDWCSPALHEAIVACVLSSSNLETLGIKWSCHKLGVCAGSCFKS